MKKTAPLSIESPEDSLQAPKSIPTVERAPGSDASVMPTVSHESNLDGVHRSALWARQPNTAGKAEGRWLGAPAAV